MKPFKLNAYVDPKKFLPEVSQVHLPRPDGYKFGVYRGFSGRFSPETMQYTLVHDLGGLEVDSIPAVQYKNESGHVITRPRYFEGNEKTHFYMAALKASELREPPQENTTYEHLIK